MTSGYPYRQVAKTILALSGKQGKQLTALALQKLMYLAHGLMLAKHGRPLVDTTFQAWKYGPVVEPLYHDLKLFGPSPISADSFFVSSWPELQTSERDAISCIQSIVAQFGGRPAGHLVDITHLPDGPWAKVYQSSVLGIDISNESIKSYFDTVVTRN